MSPRRSRTRSLSLALLLAAGAPALALNGVEHGFAAPGMRSAAISAGRRGLAELTTGDGTLSVAVSDVVLTVATYRPAGCVPKLLLLVFHGIGRDAGAYRDHAKPIADAVCAIIVAPTFNAIAFPRDRYQYGGVAKDGVAVPAGQRTVDLVLPLLVWAEQVTGQQGDLPYVLIGHSAGAQFLDRVAALVPTEPSRIIVADPSTWMLPSLTVPLPFGFGGLPHQLAEAALRRYLAEPVIVMLGGADTGSHDLATSDQAMAQGANRLTRGHNCFAMAEATARQHGWPFGWRLIEVAGVGHDAAAMFGSAEAIAAVAEAVGGLQGHSKTRSKARSP